MSASPDTRLLDRDVAVQKLEQWGSRGRHRLTSGKSNHCFSLPKWEKAYKELLCYVFQSIKSRDSLGKAYTAIRCTIVSFCQHVVPQGMQDTDLDSVFFHATCPGIWLLALQTLWSRFFLGFQSYVSVGEAVRHARLDPVWGSEPLTSHWPEKNEKVQLMRMSTYLLSLYAAYCVQQQVSIPEKYNEVCLFARMAAWDMRFRSLSTTVCYWCCAMTCHADFCLNMKTWIMRFAPQAMAVASWN